MNRRAVHTRSIVLARTNYGEADRIATLMTDTEGKVRVIVKGARKSGSKLAAGVELLTISEVGYAPSRGEIATLVSARLQRHYPRLLADLNRVGFAYDCLKQVNRLTENRTEGGYFALLEHVFAALNDESISLVHVQNWWLAQLLRLTGHGLNVQTVVGGNAFAEAGRYSFDYEHGGFCETVDGVFGAEHIKYIRLALEYAPVALARVRGGVALAETVHASLKTFAESVH